MKSILAVSVLFLWVLIVEAVSLPNREGRSLVIFEVPNERPGRRDKEAHLASGASTLTNSIERVKNFFHRPALTAVTGTPTNPEQKPQKETQRQELLVRERERTEQTPAQDGHPQAATTNWNMASVVGVCTNSVYSHSPRKVDESGWRVLFPVLSQQVGELINPCNPALRLKPRDSISEFTPKGFGRALPKTTNQSPRRT